jgi:outer membrane protein assembly factor BamB
MVSSMAHVKVALATVAVVSVALGAQTPAANQVEALFEAARTGDRARVATLLDAGVDVNARSRYNVTALGFAADKGHLDVVRLLVERGADVNVADSFYGSRAIDFALRDGHTDVALYLLGRGAQGAVSVLSAGIRRKDAKLVSAALATGQADAVALAAATVLATQIGDAAILALVSAAAAAKPAAPPPVITVDSAVLRSYEGNYQSASTGAAVVVTVKGSALTLAAPGQPVLELLPFEERRFRAENAADVIVSFSGRGGMIERLAITRGQTTVRYDREGFADATSPTAVAGAPSTAARPASSAAVSSPVNAPSLSTAPRSRALPWPAFRGTNAGGAADGQGAIAQWDASTGKNIRWKTPIPGLATSSPIVWGDRVIVAAAASDQDTTFRTGLYGDVKPVDDLSRHSFRLYALDRATGRVVWDREVFSGAPLTRRHTKSSQANSTPVTDGRHIVAVFGAIGLIVCYDMEGALRWKKDLGALDSGWFLDPTYQWGHSSSPVIYKSSVIVQADQAKGSFLAAFDLGSGREIWRTPRPDEISTWGTPTILSGAKGDELVTNGTKVRGYDPATGALLWTLGPNSEIAIGTPVVHGDVVYVTAGYPPVRPVYAVRAGARGDISLPPGRTASEAVAWSHDRDGTYISTPIVYRDQLYTLNQNGILTAYAAATGERIYRVRVGGGGAFSASPVAADGRLYLASEDGEVFVVAAGPTYVELARNVMGEVIMATPAISDGLIIVRTLRHVWGISE